MKVLFLAALLACPATAFAHGGLPVSESVLRLGETMYVPVAFWGLWIGDGVSPWQWICEEEINPNRARKFALSTDGTFYTNDTRGLTVSNDHGCTWLPATGEISQLRITSVAAHPVDGATAWATSDDVVDTADGGVITDNALFVTHDHGATFSRVPALSGSGRRYQSVLAAPSDGNTLYVTSAGPMAPFMVAVHHSIDGGMTFEDEPLNFTVDGFAPYSVEVMAIDPRDPDFVYLRAFITTTDADGGSTPLQVLLRSFDHGESVVEMTRVVGEMTPSGATRGIDGVAVDAGRGKVYVATSHGLLAADDPGDTLLLTLAPISSLTQAQCVEVHGDAVYACSSNYSPDFAALGRSDDGAETFHSVLSYQATEGPITCPAGTPVAENCPSYWLMYSAQLGINMGLPDGGATDLASGGGASGGGCHCSMSGHGASASWILAPLLLLALALRRKRA